MKNKCGRKKAWYIRTQLNKQMKYLFKIKMLSSILFMISSCIQGSDKGKNPEKTEVLFSKGTAEYRIYHNPKCPVKITVDNVSNLEIKFLKEKSEEKDSVHGKAY